jgi:hypothetical protein
VQQQPTDNRTTTNCLRHVNKTVNGTCRITAVEQDTSTTSGTLFYLVRSNSGKEYRVPCNALLQHQSASWKRSDSLPNAALITTPVILNLNDDGSALTFASALAGAYGPEWQLANDAEFRKLVTTSGTIAPIQKDAIPVDRRRDITYYNPQVKEKIKDGKHLRRIRGTIGGDKTNFTGAVSSRTASLEVVRILLNSVLADDADFMACDITDYYLGTPMERPEFMRMHRRQLSPTIIAEYDLEQYFQNDVVHFIVTKGMYGLPQAGLLAQQRLVAHLAQHDYIQSDLVPCLFTHATNGITFVLVVDDFGIKFRTTAGRDHLLETLRLQYQITVDEAGSQYLGMTIQHNKVAHTISISMPGYIEKVLAKFKHLLTGRGTAPTPAIYHAPQYGAAPQQTKQDDSALLSPADAKIVQEVVGSMLYYARAVDPTMLPATNAIASEQAVPTKDVLAQAVRLLQYAAAYPNNAVVFHKSKMHVILQVDASYLSRSKSRSVAGGIAYLGDADNPTTENGMIHSMSSIIDVIVASAGEAEYGTAFIYAQHGVWFRQIATAMGHPQPATPILCDNKFAIGLATDTIKQKRSKSIDMRFHWLRDRIRQGQFTITYLASALNLADFFTKSLPRAIHEAMMERLVITPPIHNALHTSGQWYCATYKNGRLCPTQLISDSP